MVESGSFYSTFIDPVLTPMRKRVTEEINTGEKVIDIACGTGAQVFEISEIASSVVGIDLSESMINQAKKICLGKGITNTSFLVCDATNLKDFETKSFDVAVMCWHCTSLIPIYIRLF